LAALVETYVQKSAGTGAQIAGIPGLIGAMVTNEYQKLAAASTTEVQADTPQAAEQP
jgi:hypothetical protein